MHAHAESDRARRFSIIIVHRNGTDMLLNTIQTALDTCGPEDELIVVDNGSDDDSMVKVNERFSQIKLIQNRCNRGFAAANNQGIRLAGGRYLLLLNNDANLNSNTLECFVDNFRKYPKAALLAPQLVDSQGFWQRNLYLPSSAS